MISAVCGLGLLKAYVPGLEDHNNLIKCPKQSAVSCFTGKDHVVVYDTYVGKFGDLPPPSAMYQMKLNGVRNCAMVFAGMEM